MASNFTFGPLPLSVSYVPWGRRNVVSVYIKDAVLGEKDFTRQMISYEFNKTQNKIKVGTCQFLGVTSTDKLYLVRGNKVKVFVGNTIFYVYQIENVSFDTTGAAVLRLEGIECKDSKRSFTDRDTYIYEDIDSATITTALISGVFSSGTISSFGTVFFRAERERILKALMQQADCHKADWWVSWNESESYDTDYWNIAQTRGTGVSKYSFYASGEDKNIITATNTERQNNIANYIICIGAGNELVSINLHATTNRTYLNGGDTWLNGAIAESGATITVNSTTGFPSSGSIQINKEIITYTGKSGTTFTGCTRGTSSTTATAHTDDADVINLTSLTVDSTTLFDATGTVWIGTELVTYTGKTSTTFTGITRGANDDDGNPTPIYAHSDNIEVYDEQYKTTNPQVGSSIASDEGLIEEKYDFRSVINRNALDIVAQNILAERKTIIPNIVLVPYVFHRILDDEKIELGDTVTIQDSSADLNGNYEVKAIKVSRGWGTQETCEIDLGIERNLDLIKDLSDSKLLSRELSGYAQGTPVLVQDSESDNCANNYNLNLDIVIPKGTIAVTNMNLYYDVSSYRIFHADTPSGGSVTSGSNAGSTIVAASQQTKTATNVTTTWTDYTMTYSQTSDGEETDVNINISESSSNLTNFYARVYDGTNYYPNSVGITMGVSPTFVTGEEDTTYFPLHTHTPGSGTYFATSSGTFSLDLVTGTTSSHSHNPYGDDNSAFITLDYGKSLSSPSVTSGASGHKHESPGGIYSCLIKVPGNMNGNTLTVQIIHNDTGYTHSALGRAHFTVFSRHTHTTGNHTHTVNYAISEVASDADDIAVYIDTVDYTAALETLYGTLSTSKMDVIDLSKVFTFEAGKRYTISVKPTGTPTGNCRIHAGVQGQLFINTS